MQLNQVQLVVSGSVVVKKPVVTSCNHFTYVNLFQLLRKLIKYQQHTHMDMFLCLRILNI